MARGELARALGKVGEAAIRACPPEADGAAKFHAALAAMRGALQAIKEAR